MHSRQACWLLAVLCIGAALGALCYRVPALGGDHGPKPPQVAPPELISAPYSPAATATSRIAVDDDHVFLVTDRDGRPVAGVAATAARNDESTLAHSDAHGMVRLRQGESGCQHGIVFTKHGFARGYSRLPEPGTVGRVVLQPGFQVDVQVVGLGGHAIRDATVLVAGRPLAVEVPEGPFDEHSIVGRGTTGSDGRVTISGLGAGLVFVRCEVDGHYFYDLRPPVTRLPETSQITIDMRPLFGLAIRLPGTRGLKSFLAAAATCIHMDSPQLAAHAETLATAWGVDHVALFLPRDDVGLPELLGDKAKVMLLDADNRSATCFLPIFRLTDVVPVTLDLRTLAPEPSTCEVTVTIRQPDGRAILLPRGVWLKRTDGKLIHLSTGCTETCPPGTYGLASHGWMDRDLLPKDFQVVLRTGTNEVDLQLTRHACLVRITVHDDRGTPYDTTPYTLVQQAPRGLRTAGVITVREPFEHLLTEGSYRLDVAMLDLQHREHLLVDRLADNRFDVQVHPRAAPSNRPAGTPK